MTKGLPTNNSPTSRTRCPHPEISRAAPAGSRANRPIGAHGCAGGGRQQSAGGGLTARCPSDGGIGLGDATAAKPPRNFGHKAPGATSAAHKRGATHRVYHPLDVGLPAGRPSPLFKGHRQDWSDIRFVELRGSAFAT